MDRSRRLPLEGLEWKHPSAFARNYELKLGDEVVATLEFQKLFGSLALAQWGNEQWTFKRQGFLHPRVTVRRPDSEADLALYEPNWTGRKGVLERPGKITLLFQATSMFGSEHVWKRSDGEVLLTLSPKGVFHSSADLAISAAGVEEDDVALLILLGWYVVLLAQQDHAAGAAAG